MSRNATLSTVIDAKVKKAATEYCKRRGIKLQYFVEQSLLEQLEDEIDLADYERRKNEETISLESILSERTRKKSA